VAGGLRIAVEREKNVTGRKRRGFQELLNIFSWTPRRSLPARNAAGYADYFLRFE
jgi:hypothetical protein